MATGPRQWRSVGRLARSLRPGEVSDRLDELAMQLDGLVRQTVSDPTVVLRDLTANDVNPGTGGSTTAQLNNPGSLTANVTASDVFAGPTLKQIQAVAIYGYVTLSANPHIGRIGFGLGGVLTLSVIDLNQAYGDTDFPYLFFEPVVYQPLERIRIDLTAAAAVNAGAEAFALLGLVAEQKGLTLSWRDLPIAPNAGS